MPAPAPPKSAVDSPAWAPAASALAVPPHFPFYCNSLAFEENGYTAWLYTFEDYAEQFKLSDEDHLHEVSRFLLGEACVWHQDVQVSTWADWKAQAELRFDKHEPNAIHQLGLLKMVHFKSLRNFLNSFQKTTNKALKQHFKNNSSSNCKTTIENFHSLVSIRAFVNALTHSYSAMVQAAKPTLLEEAIALVRDKYDIWVDCVTDVHAKENSEWNPFTPVHKQNKSEEMAQEVKAHLEDLNRRFDAMFMAQEQGHQSNPNPPAPFKEIITARITPRCYNCSEVGHISKDCTAPCSICKDPSHYNFICEFNPINHDRKPQGLMMAKQKFEVKKHDLSSSATPQPLNIKSNLDFPFTLIHKCQVCSQGPSPGRKLTPPPMKCTDQEDVLSLSVFLFHIHDGTVKYLDNPNNPDPSRKPPSSPSPPHMYERNSNLESEDVFKNKDLYLCLPDLDKYLPFEDGPRYNIVTVESIPESPRTNSSFSDLPSDTPSLEASPAGVAAWGYRATGQEGKDKGLTALGSHHCSHPGQMGPAMVSRVDFPGFGPIRFLNTAEVDRQGLSADPADLGEPIRSVCGNKVNAQSALYNVAVGNQPIILRARQDARRPAALSNSCNLNQPIKLHASQNARKQHTLYDPCNLAQPINSSGATCNSMHMAPSESSNLNEPITPGDAMDVDSPNTLSNYCNLNKPIRPDNAMEIDSANALNNNCNLNGPITPDDTMEIDSPEALINNCNLNEPIRLCNTMETSTPNVLSSNCNPDEPIKSGAAGANYTHSDQTSCPIPSQPIRPRAAKETNAPNVSHYNCNSDEPIRSGAAGANYTHTIPSQPIRYKKDPNWPNQFSSNSSEPMDTFHTPPE
ncbi:hypothetical protein DSO57_1027154 [Entomophthora muscae]|uniref:Uncharacterized protein n=1 Tax=Entomophthora muscae TaxID=34485 RepID=A0ACC2RSU8_9FUNG|nr:hypothetical protein DSO57_1027154 [Entomophthora muscae]